MWYATVVICSLATNGCLGLNDVRGPYDTKEQCEERTAEMLVAGHKILAENYGLSGPFKEARRCVTEDPNAAPGQPV